jgi:hypothetical protein
MLSPEVWHLDNLGIAVVAFGSALGLIAAVAVGWALARASRRRPRV